MPWQIAKNFPNDFFSSRDKIDSKKDILLPKINSSIGINRQLKSSNGKSSIIIDLQKEYDEDFELLEMLNKIRKLI